MASKRSGIKAARIVNAIRKGMPNKLAAAGGSYNTFVRWRNEGLNPVARPTFGSF